MSESLKAIQDRFAAALLDPKFEHVLSDLKTKCDSENDVRADRFSIYRGNLLAIWSKALANAFPVVQRLVGDEFFEDLARLYGRAYPSQSGDLNSFGEHFPHFLSLQESLQEYPYVAAVADLEWIVHFNYYQQDQEKISLPQFISQAGEKVQESCLCFASGVSLHKSHFATYPIWLAHQGAEVEQLTVPLETPSFCVIGRPQWQPTVVELNEASFRALELLLQGETLAQALDVSLQIQTDFDVGGQLQTWFAAGLFVGHFCKE